MTSGYIPASEEPGPDEILAALKEAIREVIMALAGPPRRDENGLVVAVQTSA